LKKKKNDIQKEIVKNNKIEEKKNDIQKEIVNSRILKKCINEIYKEKVDGRKKEGSNEKNKYSDRGDGLGFRCNNYGYLGDANNKCEGINTSQNILDSRDEIKKKINLMRLQSERKKAQIKSKIMSMRNDSAQQLQKYTKKGNKEKCFIPDPNDNDDIKKVEVFCGANFPTEMNEFMNCKILESFCYVCCEAEFGPMQLSKRENCMNTRCNKDSTKLSD